MVNEKEKGKFADLRKKAEAEPHIAIEPSPEMLAKLSPEEIQTLVHELTIHKIELELQNDELIQAQAALDASNKHFTDLYDFAPLGYFTLDKRGTILEANLTAVRQLNVTRTDLIGHPFAHFVDWDDRDKFHVYLRKLGQTGAQSVIEILLERPGSGHFWARLEGVKGGMKSHPSQLQLAVSDISGQKRAQAELAHSLKEKELLMIELQHRTRNSLNLVANMFYYEVDELPDDRTRLIFENMLSRIHALADVYQLLYQQERINCIDLCTYIQNLAGALSVSYSPEGGRVKIETRLEEMELDLNRALCLGLILNELVTNALKFAFPEGAPGVIWVELKKTRAGGMLRVSDNGVGFGDKEQLAGSGFGLALVESLATQIGGMFAVQNNNGVSAFVTFDDEFVPPA